MPGRGPLGRGVRGAGDGTGGAVPVVPPAAGGALLVRLAAGPLVAAAGPLVPPSAGAVAVGALAAGALAAGLGRPLTGGVAVAAGGADAVRFGVGSEVAAATEGVGVPSTAVPATPPPSLVAEGLPLTAGPAGAAVALLADFLAAFASAAAFQASPRCSVRRRTTGGSTVEEADLTNSPMSLSAASTSLLGTPKSLASSWTRTFATVLLLGGPSRQACGPFS